MSDTPAAPGQLIDVGGTTLHLIRRGDHGPSVVFESGLGAPAAMWLGIMESLQQHAISVAWDRPGYGWSDRAGGTLDLESVTSALHALLEIAQVPPPHILVGHSLGGLYLRRFAARWPESVMGAVFVDATGETTPHLGLAGRLVALAALPSLMSAYRRAKRQLVENTGDETGRWLARRLVSQEHRQVTKAELAAVRAAAPALATAAFPNVPVVVLGSGGLELPRFLRSWFHKQRAAELAAQLALSPRSSLEVIHASGHNIPADAPGRVIQAIENVLAAAQREALV